MGRLAWPWLTCWGSSVACSRMLSTGSRSFDDLHLSAHHQAMLVAQLQAHAVLQPMGLTGIPSRKIRLCGGLCHQTIAPLNSLQMVLPEHGCCQGGSEALLEKKPQTGTGVSGGCSRDLWAQGVAGVDHRHPSPQDR